MTAGLSVSANSSVLRSATLGLQQVVDDTESAWRSVPRVNLQSLDALPRQVDHIVLCAKTHQIMWRTGREALPYADFLVELERAGLTVRNFAELIGMNPNSITNYATRGELPQHIALVVVLIAEMAAQRVDYRKAIAKVAPTRKPRGATRQGHFGGDRQASLDLLS